MTGGRLLSLAISVAVSWTASAHSDEAPAFRLGVRADARPFVYVRSDGSYGGFLYDMCRYATSHAGVDPGAVELVPVLAGDRFEKMDDAEAPLDLLCDPTTITMERAAKWHFSPIVFFANSISLVRKGAVILPVAEAPSDCAVDGARHVVLVGWVDRTTSDETVAEMAAQSTEGPGEVAVCGVAYARHDEGVRELCSDGTRLSFYVGDGDILSAQVDEMRRQGLSCRVSFNASGARPEPYALIVGERIPDLHQRISAGIYAFFRSGEAERSFERNFNGRTKSPALEALFTLYRLP